MTSSKVQCKKEGFSLLFATLLSALLSACSSDGTPVKTLTNEALFVSQQDVATDLRSRTIINNQSAYITSQCYTKTQDDQGEAHNPCMNCHTDSKAPNYIDDALLQESYRFNEYTRINRFTNLFKDRSDTIAAISDDTILMYVKEDNYYNDAKQIILAEQLKQLPDTWDSNGNGRWDGYIPDCYFNFDNEGFDKDFNGVYSGWRAFAYYPFLGTFWPTNGSTDDVLIRLPHIFMKTKAGVFDLQTYKVNLAIVEAMIKERNVVIESVDEGLWDVDLNRNGVIDIASEIVFDWRPKEGVFMRYVGEADDVYHDKPTYIAAGLFPEGTEFLHTVRYIDVEENTIKMAPRIKELRYAKKRSYNTYSQLQNAVLSEVKEKHDFPERLRHIEGNVEEGVTTAYGWVYQGFIEDKSGYLRPQTYEESLYCVGCHSTIGAIIDSTFVFARKFEHDTQQMGWYHWTQSSQGFKEIKEPVLADGRYEYSLYLEQNGAGDEFRDNQEVMEKFFDNNGAIKNEQIEQLHGDISHLILPSQERALELNKAYKVIVDEQSYIYGRDAHVKPVANVHKSVTIDQETGVKAVTMQRYPLR